MDAKELYRWANWRLVKATTGRYVLEFNVHDALGAGCWKEADDLSSDALRALAVWIDLAGEREFARGLGALRGVPEKKASVPVAVENELDQNLSALANAIERQAASGRHSHGRVFGVLLWTLQRIFARVVALESRERETRKEE